MTFTSVSFQEYRLSQAVRMLCHTFYVIQRSEERVLCLSAEVHGDTPCHQLRDFLGFIRVVHDVAECDRAVLPVDLRVLVHVACDHDLGLRHLCLCHRVFHALGICHVAVVVPLCAGKSHSLISVAFFRCCIDTRVLASSLYRSSYYTPLVLGVAPHACAHLIRREECIHVIPITVGSHLPIYLDQFISALMCIGGHHSAF